VFAIVPASTSACVTTCDAAHVNVADTASVAGRVGVHVPRVALASVRSTDVNVTSPVFVTTIEYVTVLPAAVGDPTDVFVLTTDMAGDAAVTLMVTVDVTERPDTGSVREYVYESLPLKRSSGV
jgi:hypothetical protein